MLRLKIILWTILAPLALLFGPVPAFAMFAPRRGAISSLPKNDAHDVAKLVAAADSILLYRIFGKLLFRTRCLKRTLVLYRLLRLHGHDAVAYIGLDREPAGGSAQQGTMAGHAWLAVNGEVVDDPIFTPRRCFTPFIEIGESAKQLRGA